MSKRDTKKERRKHRRMHAEIPVEIASLSFKFSSTDSQCRVVNISCSGIYCQVDRFFPLFTTLHVSFRLKPSAREHSGEDTITCRGVVVRTEPSHPIKGCREYHIAVFVPNGIPINSLSDVTIN